MKIKTKDILEFISNYEVVDEGKRIVKKDLDEQGLIYCCLPKGEFVVDEEPDRSIFTFKFLKKDIWDIEMVTDKVDILDPDYSGEDGDKIGIYGTTRLGEQLEDIDAEELATYDDLSLVMDNILKDVKMYQNALKRKEIKGSAKKYQNESMKLDEALDTLSNAGYTVTKKNKYNFYPKDTGLSTKRCMKYVLEKHKKVFDYLKDK